VGGSVIDTPHPSNKRIVHHQDSVGYCDLNSVRNLVDLSQHIVNTLLSKGPLFSHTELSQSLVNTKGCPIRLDKVKGVQDKSQFLQNQKSGQFVVYFNGHCLSWDATNGVVMDTDPQFPLPLPTTKHAIVRLGMENVSLLYRIVYK
jgi:hypothetical protein